MTRKGHCPHLRGCDIQVSEGNTFADDCYISVLYRFANKAIEHFLATTGQYVTNDATREAAIQAAVEAEREACAEIAATVCDEHIPTGIKIYGTRAAKAIPHEVRNEPQKPFAWSYTALTGFENCPHRHWRTKVVKDIADPPGEAALFGQRAHKGSRKPRQEQDAAGSR